MQTRQRLVLLTFVTYALSAAFTLHAGAVHAGEVKLVSEKPYELTRTRTLVVHSSRLSRDFVVSVSAPPEAGSYGMSVPNQSAQSKLKRPAIYALDGGYGLAGVLAQTMIGIGAMSPTYVIAIDYPQGKSARNTDLLYQSVTDAGTTLGGGGAVFSQFLVQDLRPFLEKRFPLDPQQAVLFGHSFGGLFTANVLAESPDAFAGYIIASASLMRDSRLLAKLSAVAPRGAGQRVFVAVAGNEDNQMKTSAKQIVTALTGTDAKFAIASRTFADESHLSYYPQLANAAYAWMLPPAGKRTAIVVPPARLDRLVGVYAYDDGRVVTITRKDAALFVQITGVPGQSEILAETPERFFVPGGFDVAITFEGPASSPANAIAVAINGGPATRGIRKE